MLALTPAYPFRPAGSRAISLIHVSQISGGHRQDEGRKRMVDSQVAVSVDANSLPVRTGAAINHGNDSLSPVSRPSAPGATNAGHIQKGPVMQPELFVFPISPAAQARLTRLALRGAFDSMIDVMTDLRKLPDEGFAPLKQMGFTLVSALDQEEKAYRGKVA